MVFSPDQTIVRLTACGLSKREAIPIVRTIQKWIKCTGEEETVSRLKKLRLMFIHHLCGSKYHVPWIAVHRDGSPKGPFRVLWKLGKHSLFKSWNALMVYTSLVYIPSFRGPRMTERQFRKFAGAVRRPKPDEGFLAMGEVLINSAYSTLRHVPKFTAETGLSVQSFFGSSTRRAPVPSSYWGSAPEDKSVVDSIQVLALRPNVTKKHMRVYAGVLKGFENVWEGMVWTVDNAATVPISGRIGIIQEPGYKARVVANPYRVHQCALLPLKEHLMNLLKLFPFDYVYDQESGVLHVQKRLQQGKTCFCFDLSNASDNLPFSLQEKVLQLLGIPQYWIDCFKDISHGDWEFHSSWVPKSKHDPFPADWQVPMNRIRWSEGQPLGLGPSFASAFLLHHFLVVGIHVFLNKEPDYSMVGDDLVLYDREVAGLYRHLMNGLGVAISDEKSLVSDKWGEFLSRLISKDKILRGYKFKGTNDNSFMDIARNLGPASIRLFRSRQRRIIDVIGPLPEPYGFGWNPLGLTYWERLEPWIEILDTVKDVRVRTYINPVRHVVSMLYNSVLPYTTDLGIDPFSVPDQDTILLREFFPEIYLLGENLLPNLDYLLQLADIGRPIVEWGDRTSKAFDLLSLFSVLEKGHDISTLIRYERLISEQDRKSVV